MHKQICALMMTLSLLAACGGGSKGDEAEQMALDIRARYLSMAGCTAVLEISADYGDRIFDCRVDLEHTTGADTLLTIREPELLKGVTARLRDGESLLEFDGVTVETGPLSREGLSPLDCVPFLLTEIREGFIAQWGLEELEEEPCVRFTTADPEGEVGQGTETVLWFERENFALRRGELLVDGVTVLQCDVTDFHWKS